MKLNTDRLLSKPNMIFVALAIFSVMVGLSCVSATSDVSNVSEHVLDHSDFTMSVPYTAGTGYHWEISDESYGVDVDDINYVQDHPNTCGSSGTAYFNFHVNSDDYYVKLVLVSPAGDIVDEIDSNMLN